MNFSFIRLLMPTVQNRNMAYDASYFRLRRLRKFGGQFLLLILELIEANFNQFVRMESVVGGSDKGIGKTALAYKHERVKMVRLAAQCFALAAGQWRHRVPF